MNTTSPAPQRGPARKKQSLAIIKAVLGAKTQAGYALVGRHWQALAGTLLEESSRSKMKRQAYFRNLKFSPETLAILISVSSLLVSAIGFYMSSLRPPDLSFVTAPYIKHVVDNASFNEAFFVPLTIVNRGAKSGTLLAFELRVFNQSSGETRTYYGQYFAQAHAPTELGDFFTPITLAGYSSVSNTVCFYPLGSEAGNLFSEPGTYDFEVIGKVSNVKTQDAETRTHRFRITVDETMASVMEAQLDGEYIYPLPIEPLP